MNKKALITGISGQDGQNLSRFLLDKGYTVYGMVRRLSNPDMSFITKNNLQDVILVQGDLGDSHSINKIIQDVQPDEVYNLAAQSHVKTSFEQPEYTLDITGSGCLRMLEAIRNYCPKARFCQASSSEQFGASVPPQNEDTLFLPQSPYAAAKVYAHYMVRLYRESYGLFASTTICFNHESPQRSKDFVTRKITSWLGEYHKNKNIPSLKLGNLYAKRDWGHARDYVRAMWLALQHKEPDDFVIGTGRSHSVKDFVELAFQYAGISLQWVHTLGRPEKDFAIDINTGNIVLEIDPKFYRPAEVNYLLADASKAKRVLNWEPEINFEQLVREMVDYDVFSANEANYAKAI